MTERSLLSDQALRSQGQPISRLMAMALENPDLISLAAGFVDNETLPVDETLETCREILGDPQAGRAALQYGTTQGYPPLREELLRRYTEREGLDACDLGLTPDDVVVTSGSQQLLFLIASVLIDPGDIVLLPRPSYFVYMSTLAVFGARVVGIDIDAGGMRADRLEARLCELDDAGELGRVKLAYVCSYFDNPTGLTIPDARRRELIDVVARWRDRQRFYLLEDAAYRDLAYDAAADARSLKTFDGRNELAILTGTFSKPLAPGLKTGYGFLPRSLVGPVLTQKGSHDFGSSNFCQHLIHRLLASGRMDAHVRGLCETYRRKRDAMLETLEDEFAGVEGIEWTRPGGGLYVWLTLPEGIDTDIDGSLFRRCVDAGVIYVPGRFCYLAEPGYQAPANRMRLSFGVPTIDENREGVRRLAEALGEELA